MKFVQSFFLSSKLLKNIFSSSDLAERQSNDDSKLLNSFQDCDDDIFETSSSFSIQVCFFFNLTSLKLYGGVTVTGNSKLLPSCEVMQRKEKSYALQADLDGTL